MEIKKGVSQMAEYPNVEISYVVPQSGNMYYVMKDGVLANGVIVATLDPKHAIDEVNPCNTVGAFLESGDTLIDFDKEDIKVINDGLLLAVNSNPTSSEVLDAVARSNDETAKEEMLENAKVIEAKIMEEMGEGEIIFSDPFKEVSIYATDSYNNKLGIDCSIVGKNENGLYLHTNDVDSETVQIQIQNTEAVNEETTIPEIDETSAEDNSNVDDIPEEGTEEADGFDISEEELSNMSFDNNEATTEEEPVEEETTEEEQIEEKSDEEEQETEQEESEEVEEKENEVFDNAIELINKYMDEANKLNARIKELEEKEKEQQELIESQEKTIEEQKDAIKNNEEKIAEQEKILNEQEVKKDELNSLLSKANEVLENIK